MRGFELLCSSEKVASNKGTCLLYEIQNANWISFLNSPATMNRTQTAQGPRQVYGNEGSVHSYSLEERRSFAEYINQLLKDDPDLRDVLPLNPNSDDLFTVCSQGLLLVYVT